MRKPIRRIAAIITGMMLFPAASQAVGYEDYLKDGTVPSLKERYAGRIEIGISSEILLNGEPVSKESHNLAGIRQKIGMVFQSYELFPHLNVLDNITLAPVKVQKRPKEEVRKEALELLSRVGLRDKAESYPRQLSGGQKQRVAIVRALCMKPEILLFDEVTAALDPEMVREVLDVILKLADQGKTMLIVTHEMQFARAVADRVIFLEDGVIKEEGRPDQFFDAPQTERAKEFLRTFTFERKHKM